VTNCKSSFAPAAASSQMTMIVSRRLMTKPASRTRGSGRDANEGYHWRPFDGIYSREHEPCRGYASENAASMRALARPVDCFDSAKDYQVEAARFRNSSRPCALQQFRASQPRLPLDACRARMYPQENSSLVAVMKKAQGEHRRLESTSDSPVLDFGSVPHVSALPDTMQCMIHSCHEV